MFPGRTGHKHAACAILMLLAASNEYGPAGLCRAAAMPGRCHLWQLRVPPGRQRPDDSTSEGHAVLPAPSTDRAPLVWMWKDQQDPANSQVFTAMPFTVCLCNSVNIIISSVESATCVGASMHVRFGASATILLLRKNDLDDLLFEGLYR